jgi:long-chain acyl-CoA synthetase
MHQSIDDLNRNLIERVAVGDLLRRRARDSGQREAVVELFGAERNAITYAGLNQRVNQLVRGMRNQGLKQGDRLALIGTNSIDFLTVLFACYKAGIVVVPINFLQNPDDVRFNLEHSEVCAVFYDPLLEQLAQTCAADLPAITLTVTMGEPGGPADATLKQLIDDQPDSEILDVVIRDRDTAQVLYTSGTTSRPKGVETSHLSLFIAILNNFVSIGIKSRSVQLNVLPLFHVTALTNSLGTLNGGGRFVLHQSFDSEAIVHTLESEQIQFTVLLPMMWNALLQVPGVRERDFSALECGLYGMAPMSAKTLDGLREVFDCTFHLGSGQTEFTPAPCIFFDGSPTEFGEGNYWGVPTVVSEQAVLDDQGNEVPPGEVGEICWRGPQVMNGYLKNPEATEAVSTFGWHHSGDLGFIDSEGQLLFVDRKKDIVKSGGENVSSIKVEGVLLGIPGVNQCGVIGVPHPRWGEAVCACLQLAPGTELTEADVIEHCKKNLGNFEVPKRILFVGSFPLTGTGKVQKLPLRQQYAKLFEDVDTSS